METYRFQFINKHGRQCEGIAYGYTLAQVDWCKLLLSTTHVPKESKKVVKIQFLFQLSTRGEMNLWSKYTYLFFFSHNAIFERRK